MDIAVGNQNKVKYMATQLLAKFEENAPAQSTSIKRQVDPFSSHFQVGVLQRPTSQVRGFMGRTDNLAFLVSGDGQGQHLTSQSDVSKAELSSALRCEVLTKAAEEPKKYVPTFA